MKKKSFSVFLRQYLLQKQIYTVMKVWFDIRGLNPNEHYGAMMIKVIKKLIEVDDKNKYIVYTNKAIGLWDIEKIVTEKIGNAIHDFSISKEFKKEQFGIMAFFDHRVPVFYKWDFIFIVATLKDSFFMGKDFLERERYSYYMKSSLKRAKKVICLEKNTAWELNERLNVKEGSITVMKPFFDGIKGEILKAPIKIEIKNKHQIHGDYLIYDAGNGMSKNIEKLLKSIAKLKKSGEKIHLFMIWEDTSRDTDIRDLIVELNIQNIIHFITDIKHGEEYFYYHQSKGVVFPSIYESFPFQLSKAIKYWCPIIASDIPSIRHFMGKTIDYLNPKSVNDMEHSLKKFISKKKKPDYSSLSEKLGLATTIKSFYHIIMKG